MNLKYRDPHAVIKTTQWFSVKSVSLVVNTLRTNVYETFWRENKMKWLIHYNVHLLQTWCPKWWDAQYYLKLRHFFSWPLTHMSLQGSCLNSRVIKSVVYIWKRVFAHWCFNLTTCSVCYHCIDSSCEYAGQ